LSATFSARKSALFLAISLKYSFPATKIPYFMDRVTFAHIMCDLFPDGEQMAIVVSHFS
jgi:hypothetical protein